jgi:2-hydroxychromene-2-carboxylate isomerase
MADVDFFFDPICPWAWVTSRFTAEVARQRDLDVDWRFISLRMVNAAKDYAKDFPEGYERGHTRGLELLRVAAAARDELGRDAVLPLYTAFGRTIHNERNPTAFDDPSGVARILDELGYPASLGAAATSTEHDDLIRSDTDEALERCGGNIGTPVLSFSPPEGPSFFGPVINVAPKGHDAVDLWDAVVALGSNPHFSELKRSTRGRPQFDD